MRRQTCAVLAVIFAACGEGPVAPPAAPRPPVVDAGPPALGRLEKPIGTVTLERAGASRGGKEEPLFVGDAIDTGADSSAVLHFANDRLVELGPEGRFEVEADGAGVMLNVVSGLVLTRVPQTKSDEPDVRLTISTPFGLTRVGAAEVSVDVDRDSADVNVKLGEIELVTSSGEVRKVGAGRASTLGAVRDLAPIPMEIVTGTGSAELKSKDSKKFIAINTKNLPSLQGGDTLRVRDGRWSLAPKGSQARVTLLKGAVVTVAESGLDVQGGELEVLAPRGEQTRLGIAPGVTLISDLGGQISLRKTGAGFDVEALTGDVKIERQGSDAATIPSGGSARILSAPGATAVTPPTREAVTVSGKQVRLLHSGLKRVALTWADQPADVRVQVASNADFTKPVRDGVVHGDFINLPALVKGTWFWRVFDGENEKLRGQVSFAPEPKSADLSRLKNVVPEGAETTTIYYQDKDKPPVVTLTWKPSEGAVKSAVRVFRDGELSKPVIERTVSGTEVALPENTLVEGAYRWSVTPLDAKNTELKGGRMNKLELRFDNAVASLLIKSPRNGDAGGKTVLAAGIAPLGSRLFINGRAVPLDSQARFDTQVAPVAGRVIFRLVQGGGESITVRTVRTR